MADKEETQKEKETAREESPKTAAKRKKIRTLTLEEVNTLIARCSEKMGGLRSGYARQLIERQQYLISISAEEKQP